MAVNFKNCLPHLEDLPLQLQDASVMQFHEIQTVYGETQM